MYIKSLIYEDQSTDWKLEKIEFKPLTLLVGVSGVGKTQILKALLNLKQISRGRSLNGLKWEIEFRTSAGHDYKWCGAFQNKGFIPELEFASRFDDSDEKDKPYIDYEKLFIDETLVVDRNITDGILFENEKTVKLSQQESVISLLKEEDKIKDMYENFKKIIFDDNAGDNSKFQRFGLDDEMDEKLEKYKNLDAIRNSDENIRTKLFLLYKNQYDLFKKIESSFIDIFPYIESAKIEPISNGFKKLPSFIKLLPFIQIKEKGVPHWIDELKISSGMFRTLMHIAELHLCADDTVILIDEFENSLGINCIDELTSSIVSSERNLQFIITSHHPYIINNIGISHWKLVTRNGGVVTATDAEKFGIGKSKHQAFTQLINLDAYTDGVVS
jgi:ABC-type transport system involved in cytochrome c biogenesis ATPase subunit